MKDQFFKNKKVFITGHNGFKGSWLTLWLKYFEAQITGYSLPPYKNGFFEVTKLGDYVTSVNGDIRNEALLKSVMVENNPDILFHLAAQPLVRKSYKNPLETFSTNLIGTVNVLEAARKCKNLKTILVITSDKCYKNDNSNKSFLETDELGGHDPYSNSKAGQELIVDCYRNSFFPSSVDLNIASVRAGNVIGGGDVSEDRLIPDAIRAFSKKEKLLIRNPKSTRPWQHVLEPIAGYIELSKRLYENKEKISNSWNLGPKEKDVKTVEWIVKEFCDLWGVNASWKSDLSKHPYEAKKLTLNIDKALKELKWKPKLNAREALKLTVEWEKEKLNSKNMFDISLKQIKNYLKK